MLSMTIKAKILDRAIAPIILLMVLAVLAFLCLVCSWEGARDYWHKIRERKVCRCIFCGRYRWTIFFIFRKKWIYLTDNNLWIHKMPNISHIGCDYCRKERRDLYSDH